MVLIQDSILNTDLHKTSEHAFTVDLFWTFFYESFYYLHCWQTQYVIHSVEKNHCCHKIHRGILTSMYAHHSTGRLECGKCYWTCTKLYFRTMIKKIAQQSSFVIPETFGVIWIVFMSVSKRKFADSSRTFLILVTWPGVIWWRHSRVFSNCTTAAALFALACKHFEHCRNTIDTIVELSATGSKIY